MKQNHFKRLISWLLVFAMVLTLCPAMAFAEGEDLGTEPEPAEPFYRVFHLDAARKYFSVANIKAIIDILVEADMNQLELYFSDNQGFRLGLDDMVVTTEFGTYDLTPALGDGYSDGSKYPDGTGKYLTQAEFEDILAYATENGIEIVPCVNVPGHMGAILEEFPDLCYSSSKSSIDLTDDEAKAFAKGFVKKYAEYFASVGCKTFSFGADEFANDLGSTMGFEQIYNNGIYAEHFVPFFNEVAAIVKETGMIPRAFNDGVHYNDDTSHEFDTDVQITYWASGWGGYNLCDADILAAQGFEMINTSQGYYWVLGNAGWQVSAEKAGMFDYKLFDGGVTVYDPAGAMLCVWCDNGAADGADDGAGVVSKIRDVLIAFGGTLPAERSTVPVLDSTYFPDPAVLDAVMDQVGPYITDLTGFAGKLDLSGTNAADLTGLSEYLPGLTELNLSGTGVEEITSAALPAGLTFLNLSGCSALEFVELKDHPGLQVDFTGCSNIENLYLSGTGMVELDITAMTKLRNFDISDSQIAILDAASASRYQNAYWWNWQGAKLDLSSFSPEGKLMSGMEAYFETAELPDEIDTQESALLSAGSWSYYSGTTKVIDLGSVSKISSLTFRNSYVDWYGSTYSLKNATVSVSADGESYTKVLDFVNDGTTVDVTITLPEGTEGRYIQLVGSDYFYTDSWVVNGYAMAPKGFTYGSQQPALVRDELADLIFERDGSQYQLLDLLSENYETYKTLRGTAAADLRNAEWADTAYIADTTAVPNGVKVVITAEDGTAYTPSNVQPPELGELDNETNVGLQASILGQSGQYSGEYSYMLFDGKNNTKWCTGGNTGWAVFQLPESAVIGRWYTEHAGMLEAESMNTKAFSLQILNPDVLSEEDFLNMSSSEQNSVMGSSSYWMDLDAVSGNTATYVDRTIAEDDLQEAQVYRLYVSQSVQDTTYGAVRIYEMELFTYTGKLKLDTNGIFVADEIGTWNVSYTSRGEEIASFTLNVRLSDEDLVALSEAVESAASAAEEATRVAEEARAKADEAIAKAEEAGSSTAENKENAEKAAQEAAEAQAAAEAAEKAAADAQAAAEAARDAAAAYNTEAAASAAAAAEYAQAVAEAQADVAEMKAEIVGYLADAQKAAEEAEAARKAAEEAQRKAEEAALAAAKYYALITLSQVDLSGMPAANRAAAEEIIAGARDALDTAAAISEIETILADALAALAVLEQSAGLAFTDVPAGSYFAVPVIWAVENGITNGTSATTFSPGKTVTRAEAVTFLWRAAGQPEPTGTANPFTDVKETDFFYKAVLWAVENGITNGVSADRFGPAGTANRSQIVTFLWRAKGQPEASAENPFSDVASGDWYCAAVLWAVEKGITTGISAEMFGAGGECNRAQMVTFLYRAYR